MAGRAVAIAVLVEGGASSALAPPPPRQKNPRTAWIQVILAIINPMKTQVEDKKETVLDEYFSPFTIFLVVFFFTALCFVFLILDVIHRTAYYDLSCLILTIPAILIIVLRFKNSNVGLQNAIGYVLRHRLSCDYFGNLVRP